MSKTFQQLDLSNSFLFAAALEDEETCQLVLEIILGSKIPKVKVHAEHSILINSEFKSVRLDIYASDEMQVNYNLEAQNENEGNLAKRSRYYQAEMDVSSLKPGEDYNSLQLSYVIFICAFDPFGEGLYRYTFEERCMERDIGLGDGTKKIFLNMRGENDKEVPEVLIHFLKYMEESTSEYVSTITDEPIVRLHEKVTELKKRRKLEARYMTLEEWMKSQSRAEREAATKEAMEKGMAEGIEKGRAEGIEKGMAEGIVAGKAEDILMLLSELGTISEELEEKISSEKDIEVLKRWLKIAVKAETIEEFQEKI